MMFTDVRRPYTTITGFVYKMVERMTRSRGLTGPAPDQDETVVCSMASR